MALEIFLGLQERKLRKKGEKKGKEERGKRRNRKVKEIG